MGIIIDAAIILLILLSVYLGYRKGLIALAISIFSIIISIIITVVLYRPIGDLIINSTKLDEKIQGYIQENVEKTVSSDSENKIKNQLVDSARQGVLPDASKSLSTNIIYGGTMILLFIISRICLKLISSLADLIAKLPIIKQCNKAGGIIFGLLRGVLITYVILMIINLFVIIKPENTLNKAIDESHLAKFMSSYNVLNIFLKK